jgi:hypothetical protein
MRKIIVSLAAALLVVAALAPSAGAASDPQSAGGLGRTPTELGQAVGEPGEGTRVVLADQRESSQASSGLGRTPTEIGQAVGEPGHPNGAYAFSPGTQGVASPDDGSGGFDWGDAAIGAALALIVGGGALAIASRRRGSLRRPRTPVTSS